MRMRSFHKRGFTLIELLVVIAIIGLLSAVVLASLTTAQQKGRDARRLSDIKQIQLALELYYDANQSYPTDIYAANVLAPGYIATMPHDPSSNLPYAYVGLTGYASGSVCGSYHLGARLEQSGSTALSSDFDGSPNGTYGSGTSDGPACTGSSWAGNNDIAATGNDFSGLDPIYDVRP